MKKRSKINAFDIISIAITVLVVAFISYALLSILIGGLPHMKDALLSKELRFAICLSVYTASISTVLCVIIALPCAYALTRTSMPFKKTAQVIIELPLSLPYLLLGLSLLIVFSSDFGAVLAKLGLRVIFDRKGIVMAQFIVNLPFAVRLMRTTMEALDMRLEFIAGTLGASRWKRFCTVLLPLCGPAILTMAVMVWSRALGEFGATLMLVGVTRMKTETLPASIFLNISTGNNGLAMASAIILMAIAALTLTLTSLIGKKGAGLSRVGDVIKT